MTAILRVLQRTRDDSDVAESFVQGRPAGTRRIYLGELRTFLQWANKAVHHVRASDLRAYVEQCRKDKLKPATLHRKVVILKAFYAFLTSEGELSEDPMCLVESPPSPCPGKPRTITQEQMKAFFSATGGVSIASMRDRAMFMLMAATGLRISEVRGLSVRDVGKADEAGWKTLRVTGKGQKEREVHVRPEVWAVVLGGYLQRRTEFMDESSPLFAAIPRAKPIRVMATDRRMSLASIYGRFKRLAKKAGLPVPRRTQLP